MITFLFFFLCTVYIINYFFFIFKFKVRFFIHSFQMHLDSPEALGVLNTLFETVAPSSLRPVDMLLKSMFTIPVTMVRDSTCTD